MHYGGANNDDMGKLLHDFICLIKVKNEKIPGRNGRLFSLFYGFVYDARLP